MDVHCSYASVIHIGKYGIYFRADARSGQTHPFLFLTIKNNFYLFLTFQNDFYFLYILIDGCCYLLGGKAVFVHVTN